MGKLYERDPRCYDLTDGSGRDDVWIGAASRSSVTLDGLEIELLGGSAYGRTLYCPTQMETIEAGSFGSQIAWRLRRFSMRARSVLTGFDQSWRDGWQSADHRLLSVQLVPNEVEGILRLPFPASHAILL